MDLCSNIYKKNSNQKLIIILKDAVLPWFLKNVWKCIEVIKNQLNLIEIDMGIGGMEFGSSVTRIPGLVFSAMNPILRKFRLVNCVNLAHSTERAKKALFR